MMVVSLVDPMVGWLVEEKVESTVCLTVAKKDCMKGRTMVVWMVV